MCKITDFFGLRKIFLPEKHAARKIFSGKIHAERKISGLLRLDGGDDACRRAAPREGAVEPLVGDTHGPSRPLERLHGAGHGVIGDGEDEVAGVDPGRVGEGGLGNHLTFKCLEKNTAPFNVGNIPRRA